MSFKINNGFLLNADINNITEKTNIVNDELKKAIIEHLTIEYMNLFFKYFIIFNNSKTLNKFNTIEDFFYYMIKDDFIFKSLLKEIDFSKKQSIEKILFDFIFFSKSFNINNSLFNLDIFVYHKTIDLKTFYFICGTSNSIEKSFLDKINIPDIEIYNCNNKNDYSNLEEWQKVLNFGDKETSMSRIQVSYDAYYYKIIDNIKNKIESNFPNEKKIKEIIYMEKEYNKNIDNGLNPIISSIYSQDMSNFKNTYFKDFVNREDLIKIYKGVL